MAQLNLLVLRVEDLGRAEAFYAALGLTFERHRHGTGPEHLASTGDFTLELYPKRTSEDDTTRARIGFAVANVDAALHAIASHCNIVSPAADSPWGRRAVVKDPDGHTVELVERQSTN